MLRNAEKLLRTGKLDLAIAEYVRLVEEEPHDWPLRDALGDLYVRADRPGDALAQYAFIADHFFTEEAFPQAEALYKKILTVAPDEESAQLRLGEIAEKQGFLAEAQGYFAAAAARRRAAPDPSELFGRLERELRAGRLDAARDRLADLRRADTGYLPRVLDLGWELLAASPNAAYVCIEAAVDHEAAAGNYTDAAAFLQEFTTRAPGQIAALLKLAHVCVKGGLEATMYETEAQLADTYLELEMGAEARLVAEHLVAREPWEPVHIDRFRRALLLLNVADPDAVIAERLSGKGPFVAVDPFAAEQAPEVPVTEPEMPEQPEPAPERDPEPATPPERDPEPAAPPVREPSPTPPPRRDPEPDIPLRRRSETPPSAPAPAPAPPPVRATGNFDIDLTDVLSQLQGMARPEAAAPVTVHGDVDDAFDSPRSEASRQAGVQEANEQLELARTYLDMGMADEAIGALTRAAKLPSLRFEAASRLGRLYVEKEDPARAVEWLERAAEAPAPSPDEGRELLYDLGVTLEATGEVSRALAVFMELQADAGDYRDVAARVDRLSRDQTGG